MSSYQLDCGYPTANQFLTSSQHAVSGHPIVQSPLAATTLTTNSSSISPSPAAGAENSMASSNSDSSVGTLTPDAVSQTSALGSTTTASTAVCSSMDNAVHPYTLSVVAGSSGGLMTSGGGVGCGIGILSGGIGSTATPACCDNGRPLVTDPVTGQTMCPCQYDAASNSSRLSSLGPYSRLTAATPVAGVGMSVFGSTYPSNDQNPYPSIAVETATPFYTSLNSPYALKDTTSSTAAWTSTALQPSSYYAYDPTFGACGYGASYDLASRRKNATRESTATLKAWLNEHMKNPYPTKGEKIMLAIITKMTLTQVSTWFANARRRLKKENKMTWEPKNRTDDEDAMVSDEEKDQDDDANTRLHTTAGQASSSTVQQTPVLPTIKQRLEYDRHLSATGGNGAMGIGHNHHSARSSIANNSTSASCGNNVANSVTAGSGSGSATPGIPTSVGVAADLSGNHSISGSNTQAKGGTSFTDPYHLTLPQNLQQYSTNFYYNSTANNNATLAVGGTASQHSYHHPHQQPTAAAVATAAAVEATISPVASIRAVPPPPPPPAQATAPNQLSYENSSLLMPPQHTNHHSHHGQQHHLLASSTYNLLERR